jgi:hypothetical protein
VGLLDGYQELGGLAVGLQRVRRHHHAGEIQVGQQRLEAGHLTGRAADLALGEHRTGGVVHHRQQVDLAALGVSGAAQGLAVDRDRTPAAAGAVAVGKPCANRGGQRLGIEAGKGSADGGLGRDQPPAGERVAAGAERRADALGCVRGPFGDRRDRPRTGQDRSGGDDQDGDQRVTTPGVRPRVFDRGKIGEQVPGLGWLELTGMGELGQAVRDRG